MREERLYLNRTYASWCEGEPVTELPEERVEEPREAAVLGKPEQVASDLETYLNPLGDSAHFILRTYSPAVSTNEMVDAVETIGEEVLPRFE